MIMMTMMTILTMMTVMTLMIEPVHEVGEVPPRHCASVPVAHMAANIIHEITMIINNKSNLSQSSGTSDGDEILASCATGVAEKAADEVGRSRTSEVGVRSIAGEGVGTLLAKGSW